MRKYQNPRLKPGSHFGVECCHFVKCWSVRQIHAVVYELLHISFHQQGLQHVPHHMKYVKRETCLCLWHLKISSFYRIQINKKNMHLSNNKIKLKLYSDIQLLTHQSSVGWKIIFKKKYLLLNSHLVNIVILVHNYGNHKQCIQKMLKTQYEIEKNNCYWLPWWLKRILEILNKSSVWPLTTNHFCSLRMLACLFFLINFQMLSKLNRMSKKVKVFIKAEYSLYS